MSGNIDFNFHKRCETGVLRIDEARNEHDYPLLAKVIRYGATAEEMGQGWTDLHSSYLFLSDSPKTNRPGMAQEILPKKYFYDRALGKGYIKHVVQSDIDSDAERAQVQGGSRQGTEEPEATGPSNGDSIENAIRPDHFEEGDVI